jgi:hypothetical protein
MASSLGCSGIVHPGAFRNDRVRVVSGANLCPVDPSIDGDLSWITSKYIYDVIKKDNVIYRKDIFISLFRSICNENHDESIMNW